MFWDSFFYRTPLMAAPVSSCYEKYLFWKVAVQKNCSERELLRITGIRNQWWKPMRNAFELSVELHITKFTGRHFSRVSLVQVISYEFCKTFKNIYFEEYLWTTAFGSRLESHVEIEPQRFTTFTLSFSLSIWPNM